MHDHIGRALITVTLESVEQREAKIDRLRGLLREARDSVRYVVGSQSLLTNIDAALAGATDQPSPSQCKHEWTDVARCLVCGVTYDMVSDWPDATTDNGNDTGNNNGTT